MSAMIQIDQLRYAICDSPTKAGIHASETLAYDLDKTWPDSGGK